MRLITALAVLALSLSACGGGPATSPTTSNAPSAGAGSIVAQVASYELVAERPGRLLVALLAADNRWLSFGSVDMDFTYMGDRTHSALPGVGVATATAEFLPIPGTPEGGGDPPTLTNPADGRGVYAVEPITFPAAGFWQVTAHGAIGDGTSFTADAAFEVLASPSVVGMSDEAPRSDNAVIGDAGVAPVSLDSRAADGEPIPDPELHATSIADAIAAGHPALVVFSTPVYCVSRFCGPVTDLVSALSRKYANRAAFIHVEIYRDFQANQLNDTVRDWLQAPSGDLREPWVYLIGADGTILESWDTMVTRGELEARISNDLKGVHTP